MKAEVLKALTDIGTFFPVSVQINLTNRCIAKCNMCFKHSTWPQEDIDPKILLSLFAELVGMNVQNIVFSGGEPFLHNSFSSVCQYLASNKVPYGIITSGLWGKTEDNKYIVENAAWVRFSIDSIEKEEYKKVRGVDGIGKAIENVKWSNDLNKNTRVNVTLQKDTLSKEEEIKNFFDSYGINTKFYKAYGTDSKIHLDKKVSKSKKCYVTKFHCIIDPSGDVYPCCHLYNDNGIFSEDIRKYAYGNIKEDSFYDIWKNFITSDYLSNCIEPKTFDICKNCDRYDSTNLEVEGLENKKINIFL